MSSNPTALLCSNSTKKLLSKTGWARIRVSTIHLTRRSQHTIGNNDNPKLDRRRHFKLVVIGGGAGGCSVAAKFSTKLKPNSIAVIEPSDVHYYQPMWTLVGGGLKTLEDSARPMNSVLPSGIEWVKDKAVNIDPISQRIRISNGQEIKFDYLVVAIGIQLQYDKIKGLTQALNTPGVCSNYSADHVNKTFEALRNFKEGNAVFTFPNTPVKCAGAPQKILYLAEDYLRRNNKKQNAKLIYCTSLGVLFGVKHYADALWKIVKERDISVNLRHNLIEVNSKEKRAVFQNLDKPQETKIISYEMLHVTPPMGPYEVLKTAPEFCDTAGFMNVNKETLQHIKYPNIFGLGDCTNLPTAKTAAAVAAENSILVDNLLTVMNNKDSKLMRKYDGYTSCPLVTSDRHCMLAEFDYNLQPLETFPFSQDKERRSMFHLKRDAMPVIYWNLMLKGYWNGPGLFRKLLHLGFGK